jgi:hypothetical protein
MTIAYGVKVGQIYVPADGSKNELKVVDTTTYAHCSDIIVFDKQLNCERRIDSFKLARVRYTLAVIETGERVMEEPEEKLSQLTKWCGASPDDVIHVLETHVDDELIGKVVEEINSSLNRRTYITAQKAIGEDQAVFRFYFEGKVEYADRKEIVAIYKNAGWDQVIVDNVEEVGGHEGFGVILKYIGSNMFL